MYQFGKKSDRVPPGEGGRGSRIGNYRGRFPSPARSGRMRGIPGLAYCAVDGVPLAKARTRCRSKEPLCAGTTCSLPFVAAPDRKEKAPKKPKALTLLPSCLPHHAPALPRACVLLSSRYVNGSTARISQTFLTAAAEMQGSPLAFREEIHIFLKLRRARQGR